MADGWHSLCDAAVRRASPLEARKSDCSLPGCGRHDLPPLADEAAPVRGTYSPVNVARPSARRMCSQRAAWRQQA